jgi:hypothetical protein
MENVNTNEIALGDDSSFLVSDKSREAIGRICHDNN